ncbi:HAD superfamily hydrolase (TIGR01549 family) [Clostridium beijerinckii]|uniref:HAD-IA family hydrolase n=1 Tax=Clostridium beijerinckii TaxID=1520 RepID=UPI0014948E7A|nr:HAD superfamily hydrolase (TIGR01549 family) [Clostridium beijerinckii]
MKDALLSIIIPVYNTEKYLKRCLDSVIKQTYRNIEIIVVNDCSPGNAEEIIHCYMEQDNRIKYITYERNKGLFCARLKGAEIATGDYIAFIDSDDYVTIDFYNCLVKSALKNNSDIVIGKTIFERDAEERYVNNLHDCCFLFEELNGEEVRERYFKQKGLCFSWHTVWNKIYKKDLWDRCFLYYQKITEHLIMTEDIAFSTVLFYYANKVTTIQNEGYFYCQNGDASTNVENITIEKFEKNIKDVKLVFDFVNDFFKEVNAQHWIRDAFFETKKYYSRMWRELGDRVFLGNRKARANKVMDEFIPEYKEHTTEDDHFFESINTRWNGGLEYIKEQIITGNYEYISFDIFDTLICRPLYNPTDLFYMLDKKFEELYKTNISFYKIRITAESIARKKENSLNPAFQDVNIDEIYNYISTEYNIPDDIAQLMKEEEKNLEIQLCSQRKSVKELFDAALISGKKVIIVSDMYLDEETIIKILSKNGYHGYEKLYLSSTLRLTKNNGALFKKVLDDLNVSGSKILHLGDTWQNDITNAKAVGIETTFIPKALEVFENKIPNICTNNCAYIAKSACGIVQDSKGYIDSLGFRSMLAIVANKYFDNPYRSFNEFSDFNIDPYFMGYYAVGMHMAGIVKWILEESEGKEYENIHFMSRDGYLPMKIYEKYYEIYKNAPEAKYIYTSRKSLLPGMLISELDFYDLPIEFRNHTPQTILSLLKFCSKEVDKDVEVQLKNNGILYNKAFENEEEYNHFVKYYLENLYDPIRHREAYSVAKDYYSILNGKKDVTFDLGYSGRIQGAVSELSGEGINVYFIHSDSKKSDSVKRKHNFKINSFYDFTPNITGLIREHLFSDPGPSCIGFSKKEGSVVPGFETEEKDFQDLFIVDLIQRGALDFTMDYITAFREYIKYIPFKSQEVSLVFEGMLINAKDFDRRIFKASYFEDLVYGARDRINIYDFIRNEIEILKSENSILSLDSGMDYSSMIEKILWGRNRIIKCIIYAMFDRKTLKERIKYKLKNNPIVFRICKKMYKTLKRILG